MVLWLDAICSMRFLRFLAHRYEGLVKLGIIADYCGIFTFNSLVLGVAQLSFDQLSFEAFVSWAASHTSAHTKIKHLLEI